MAKTDDIKFTRVGHTVEFTFSRIVANKLITQPSFQRLYWWGNDQQTALIMTILGGRIIPELHTIRDATKDVEEVVDGQQRLETIRRFLLDEFALNRATCEYPELVSQTFSQLSPDLQNRIKNYELSFCRIDSDTLDDQNKILVFSDLNRKSSTIYPQELRNAHFAGAFNQFLRELAQNQKMLMAMNLSKPHPRMLDVENVLCFIAALEGDYKHYAQQLSLTHFMSRICKVIDAMNDEERKAKFTTWRESFEHGLNASISVFGNKPFSEVGKKSNSRLFSRRYFVSYMLGFQKFKLSEIIKNSNSIKTSILSTIKKSAEAWGGHESRTASATMHRSNTFADAVREGVNDKQ